ncbi:MAG TPA: ABC transporter permease subunit, partial [Thermoanaerobaculia bacterium]|nr:ABC transporter permease subunit [Thermoanaerobaculia bacterium]
GASRARVLFVHVLPGSVMPALATAPYVLGAAVLTEAALSFLGLGTPPPTPSWGRALADARGTLAEAWWCVVPPAVALLLFVLASRRLGEALTARIRTS